LFLNVLLALNPPPLPDEPAWWLRLLMPFWPEGALERGAGGWLQGWLVVPAVAFWHHATVLMRPGHMDRWRTARVLFAYLIALVAILIHANTPLIFDAVSGDPLYLNSMQAGPLSLLFLTLLVVFTAMCLVNLIRSERLAPPGMPKKQYDILILATLMAGMIGPVVILDSMTRMSIPLVVLSSFLGIAVSLLGYGVARYSAVMEGRTIRRDFVYNVVSMTFITLLYLIAIWLSVRLYSVPASAYLLVLVLAIVSHSMIDIARRTLDPFFYQQGMRQLRVNLRRLASLVGEYSLEENLQIALQSLCSAVRASYGLILTFENDSFYQAAAYHWGGRKLALKPADLLADDVLHIDPGRFPEPLAEAALLMPLYNNTDQFGALILGRPVNGTRYSAADVELLLFPSDQIADAIVDSHREAETMARLAELTQEQVKSSEKSKENVQVKEVEDALRNLYDYAYLGDSTLAALKLVRRRVPLGPVTHLDRGKCVNSVLSETVEKLRPDVEIPSDPPPREWYPYLILHGAYLEDQLNREIMARLYISEGTFNRTRRSAIRSVARALEEMEAALH
jgi:hypothetical protein